MPHSKSRAERHRRAHRFEREGRVSGEGASLSFSPAARIAARRAGRQDNMFTYVCVCVIKLHALRAYCTEHVIKRTANPASGHGSHGKYTAFFLMKTGMERRGRARRRSLTQELQEVAKAARVLSLRIAHTVLEAGGFYFPSVLTRDGVHTKSVGLHALHCGICMIGRLGRVIPI